MKAIRVGMMAGLLGMTPLAMAQETDFNLTYHVERTPAARLSIESCGRIVVQMAAQSKLRADVQSFPKQLIIVKGGRRGTGAFVVQCIDYSGRKGAMGGFADRAFAAIKAGVR